MMRTARWFLAISLAAAFGSVREAPGVVVISEFMASNGSNIQDEDGNFSDWIELQNTGASAVDLDGWHLTDDSGNLIKWRFPAVSLGAGGFLRVFASEKDRRNPAAALHTNFKLAIGGEYLALVRPDGRTVEYAYAPAYTRQLRDISYGIGAAPGSFLWFDQPTPGAANGAGFPGASEEPRFSRPGGAYSAPFSLALSVVATGTTIRYTTDGTEPTAASPVYSAPISISSTVVVMARSFRSGLLPSPIVEHSYVRIDSSAQSFTSDLPLVVVNTFGRSIGANAWTAGHILVVDRDAGGRSAITGPPDFAGGAAFKVRGSSTAGQPKQNFSVEMRDEEGEDRDVDILDFPRESDFILHAPYNFDRALVRNPLIYDLSNQVGRYATRTRAVEVYLNTGTGMVTSSNYHGVYTLMEKIKRDPNRVPIERLTPGDSAAPAIQGGYILKIDRKDPGDVGFSAAGQSLAYVDPKEQEVSPQQAVWIKGYFDAFANALNGPAFRDPINGYARHIDPDSWVDHHILNVLAFNVDALRLSTYFFKSRFGRVEMGPIWDFDRSMESYDNRDDNPTAWSSSGSTDFFGYPWWSRLFQDPDFWQKWRDRWHELRSGTLSIANMHAIIDRLADEVRESQARNFSRWPQSLRAGGWQGEVNHLKQWLETRANWIDSQFPAPPAFSAGSRLVTPGLMVSLSAPSGAIYYTLDDSDPRRPGGSPSPAAIEYGSSASAVLLSPATHSAARALVPADGSLGTSWTQRGFDDAGWRTSTTGIGVGYERGSGYENFINLDVEAEMYNIRQTVYIRIPFDVADPSLYSFLTLRMMYDDGFVAYLNGAPVASANAPASPQWDSAAAAQHDDTQAVVFQAFNISSHVGRLAAGTNVLAIHGLNSGLTSSDLLIVPEIIASGTFTGGQAIPVEDFTRIRARTFLNGDWSAPSLATYVLDRALTLRVTEIHYHPPAPAGGPYTDEDFEFIEIQNIGAAAVDLRGVRITGGIEFDFTAGPIASIAPGEFIVVARNLDAFQTAYDAAGILIAGQYGGRLENQGESVRLENGIGEVIQEFAYRDFWHPITDGGGHSLVIIDPDAPLESWNLGESWKPSELAGGSPGEGENITGGRQLPGDANQDGRLDIGDAVRTLLLLFHGDQHTPPCDGPTAAAGGNIDLLDNNGDAAVDASDAIHLLLHLFRQGPPPTRGTRCLRLQGCSPACSS